MTTAQPVSVEAQDLYKFFNPGNPTKAEYDGETLPSQRPSTNLTVRSATEPSNRPDQTEHRNWGSLEGIRESTFVIASTNHGVKSWKLRADLECSCVRHRR